LLYKLSRLKLIPDLYTYFYEKGLKILKPDGVLSYIVTNKWFKAGYGEPLRRFFAQNSVVEQILDFGHAPIFEDADVFPCIVSVRTPATEPEPSKPVADSPVRVCPVPREKLAGINLSQYVQQEGYDVPWSRFAADSWSLEPPAVDELMQKIKSVGIPLKDYSGVKPYRGILTGFNEAFLINNDTRNRLMKADPNCAEIIKPYLRGQDVRRWFSTWQGIWMIFCRRGIDIDRYPAIKAYLEQYRQQLEPRPKDWDINKQGNWHGRKPGNYHWYEIQDAVDYWRLFGSPKIIWKDLSTYSEFCIDNTNVFTNDLCFILPSNDQWLLSVLNSPLMWYYLFRTTIHGVNETLRLKNIYTESLPIAQPTDEIRSQVEPIATRLIEITKTIQEASREVLDWLQVEQSIDKLGQKLDDFASLDCDQFVQEVKIRKPKGSGLNPKALKELREVYNDYAPHIQTRRAEALSLETRLSDLVNQAYRLTPEEIDLMWKTAPPRMPIPKPIRSA
jgi:TaqI-like C-terminal specificity domain/Eco57I restriction-modification methylase